MKDVSKVQTRICILSSYKLKSYNIGNLRFQHFKYCVVILCSTYWYSFYFINLV